MASTQEVLITLGAVGMLGSVIGGGMKAFGVELPAISSTRRQIAIFVVGLALLSIGLLTGENKTQTRPNAVPRIGPPPTPTNTEQPTPVADDSLSYFAPESTLEKLFGPAKEERHDGELTYKIYTKGDVSPTVLVDYREHGERMALAMYTYQEDVLIPNSSGTRTGSYTFREAARDCTKLESVGAPLTFVAHGCSATNATGRLYQAFLFDLDRPWNESVGKLPDSCLYGLSLVPTEQRRNFIEQKCAAALSLKASGWILSSDDQAIERVWSKFVLMQAAST